MADQDPAELAREVLMYPALPEKVKLARAVLALTEERDRMRELLAEARRKHYECEDSWYSCPMSEDGCSNDAVAPECRCGADEWNAKIDAALRGKETGDEARKALRGGA